MNMVLWNGGRQEFYVASTSRRGVDYVARGKRLSSGGSLLQTCAGFEFDTEAEAERKAKDLAKTKRERGYEDVHSGNVPAYVERHFEVPPGMRVTVEELAAMLDEALKERYVVLGDVSGLEGVFDPGVEYMAVCTDVEGEYVGVYDKFGQMRELCCERVASQRPTEKAEEAWMVSQRFKG